MYQSPSTSRPSLGNYNYSCYHSSRPSSSLCSSPQPLSKHIPKPTQNVISNHPSVKSIDKQHLNRCISSKKYLNLENNDTERLKIQLFKKKEMVRFYQKECQRRRDRFQQNWKQRQQTLLNTINNLNKLVTIQLTKNVSLEEQLKQWGQIQTMQKMQQMLIQEQQTQQKVQEQDDEIVFDDSLMSVGSKQTEESMLI